MIEVGKNSIHIIGLSVVTSNDIAQQDLSTLWRDFSTTSIKE
ncbi:MAG: hypothetical protein Q7V63_06705 [Gammaproteobacteria bacterium]|nr:hypothetical protein [Gammaproteobacteria bacterium]